MASVLLAARAAVTPANAQSVASADSIVLQRMPGFSPRPAYQVSITRAGKVRFVRQSSRQEASGAFAAVDSIAPSRVHRLLLQADRSGFSQMPAEIRSDKALCPTWRTDASSVIITVYTGSASQRVNIYEGCVRLSRRGHVPRVQKILDLAVAIDELTRTQRWR